MLIASLDLPYFENVVNFKKFCYCHIGRCVISCAMWALAMSALLNADVTGYGGVAKF